MTQAELSKEELETLFSLSQRNFEVETEKFQEYLTKVLADISLAIVENSSDCVDTNNNFVLEKNLIHCFENELRIYLQDISTRKNIVSKAFEAMNYWDQKRI